MTAAEIARMFPGTPAEKFAAHHWRSDVVTLARLKPDVVAEITQGAANFDWPVQVNTMLPNGGFSLIISIGQVVPHEVAGMANHTKNLFVGTGGKEAIDKSHFLGAVYGIERTLGRTDTPVRALWDESFRRCGDLLPPVLFVLTVIGPRPDGSQAVRGLFIGTGRDCFTQAAALSAQVNVTLLDEPVRKAVVYLEPEEFRSTWLGNKAVYRTRLAMADKGELLILAPGVTRFGEDEGVDALIRRYGYRPAAQVMELARTERDLADNLSVAAHLVHGSSEGRFTVRYCTPQLSQGEIESAGYQWGSLDGALARYDAAHLSTGWHTSADGERFFFIPNPALGLWANRARFI
jgi:nickel-dependent lactate racemase